jgi:hypothetical protein
MRLADILVFALFAGAAATQSVVSVGPTGSFGCQAGGPVLSGGALAAADVSFDYDAVNARLHVTVTNTSPITTGVPNPLVTQVFWNVPEDTVTGATLAAQSGSGGAAPAFGLLFDADASTTPNPNHGNCFGFFNFGLTIPNVQGGIANADADTIAAPPGSWVLGPASFDIDLTGPNVHGLTNEAFASATSRGAPLRNTSLAVKFQAGGAGGAQSGTIGNGDECRTAVFLRGEPRIGNHVGICVHGSNGCHACLEASFFPGPTNYNGMVIEIGLPILASFDLGNFVNGATEFCLPLDIPNSPALVGLTLYFVNATFQTANPVLFMTSPQFSMTIAP